jgi:hypothetical protein
MGTWFAAGGFGMVAVAVMGMASLFIGGRAVGAPTESRLRFLRGAPGILAGLAAFAAGTNLWAVYLHVPHDDAKGTMLVGMLEAAQPLTLAGMLIAGVLALRLVAEGRAAGSR